MKSARRKSEGSLVGVNRAAARRSSLDISPVGSQNLAVTVDFGGRQVVTDGVKFLTKFHRERQAHVSQPDNGDDFTHLFRYLCIMQMAGKGVQRLKV